MNLTLKKNNLKYNHYMKIYRLQIWIIGDHYMYLKI